MSIQLNPSAVACLPFVEAPHYTCSRVLFWGICARHIAIARDSTRPFLYRAVHALIGALETPLLFGQLVSLIEAIMAKVCRSRVLLGIELERHSEGLAEQVADSVENEETVGNPLKVESEKQTIDREYAAFLQGDTYHLDLAIQAFNGIQGEGEEKVALEKQLIQMYDQPTLNYIRAPLQERSLHFRVAENRSELLPPLPTCLFSPVTKSPKHPDFRAIIECAQQLTSQKDFKDFYIEARAILRYENSQAGLAGCGIVLLKPVISGLNVAPSDEADRFKVVEGWIEVIKRCAQSAGFNSYQLIVSNECLKADFIEFPLNKAGDPLS